MVNHDPEQRIAPQELWDAVKARQVERRTARDAQFKLDGNPLSAAHRPSHLLSNLVFYGACGERLVDIGGGRWRCRNHRGHANGSVTTRERADRVLAGIRERLPTPPLIARFAAELQRELEDARRDQGASRGRIKAELGDTRNRIAMLVRRIEGDADAPFPRRSA